MTDQIKLHHTQIYMYSCLGSMHATCNMNSILIGRFTLENTIAMFDSTQSPLLIMPPFLYCVMILDIACPSKVCAIW